MTFSAVVCGLIHAGGEGLGGGFVGGAAGGVEWGFWEETFRAFAGDDVGRIEWGSWEGGCAGYVLLETVRAIK